MKPPRSPNIGRMYLKSLRLLLGHRPAHWWLFAASSRLATPRVPAIAKDMTTSFSMVGTSSIAAFSRLSSGNIPVFSPTSSCRRPRKIGRAACRERAKKQGGAIGVEETELEELSRLVHGIDAHDFTKFSY